MLFPQADKIISKRKFGFVEGEFRGSDKTKLINPPIELDDNYHWMRDDSRTDTKIIDHISKENDYTDNIMGPHKELIQTIYSEVKSYIVESYDTYAYELNLKKSWKYFTRYTKDKDYPSYWRKMILEDGLTEEEELLDINKLAEGKSQCDVTSFQISPDHKNISFGVDYDGSENYEFILINLELKQEIPTPIPKLTYCSYFWVSPSIIYYLLNDKSNRLYQLWMYNIWTKLNYLVYEETNPDFDLGADITSDEKYVIISSGNYDSNYCLYIDWELNPFKINNFLPMISKFKYSIDHHKLSWYIHTNKDAINWQVLKINESYEYKWDDLEEFLPPNEIINISSFEIYEKFFIFKTKINGNIYINLIDILRNNVKVITHLENKVYTWEEYNQIDFSNIRSELVYNINGGVNNIYSTDKYNIAFSSMIHPTQLFDYNNETLEFNKVYEKVVPNYNQDLYESKRLWIEQTDTRLGIPVSIIYKKDLLKSNKTNPLYLYGYGSYGITITPDFNYKILPLLDRGYVYAIAHIRGGSFLGYDWYEDGRMFTKLNTFNDFIRCAEYFSQSDFIDPKKIIIEGRSAGGLLIGTSIALRPDLFHIAIPGVPFVDVLNTMSDSTIPLTKEEWTQWGNPNELEAYEYIKQYCPYTNIKINSYPHMYCSAGLHDPRVPYWEILKLIAKIREYKTDNNIQIIRIETSQGHFGGSSRYKLLEELAEKYAFIFTR